MRFKGTPPGLPGTAVARTRARFPAPKLSALVPALIPALVPVFVAT